VLLVINVSLVSFGQIIAHKGTHSIENTLQKLELNCSAEKAYFIAYKKAVLLDWSFNNTDSKLFVFSATTPKTMKRWDDDVNLYIDAVNENKCIISIKSKLGHKPNKDYITLYLISIEEQINMR